MYSSIIIMKLFTDQHNCVTLIFSSGSNYQRNVWLGPNKPCEAWLGIAAWCVIYYFHNGWRMTFLWHFCDGWYHLKLEAETLKKDGYDTNLLPFFSFFNQTSNFLWSNNDRILVNVVNIFTTLDIIFVEPTFVPNYHFCNLSVTVKRGLLIHMTGWTEFCESLKLLYMTQLAIKQQWIEPRAMMQFMTTNCQYQLTNPITTWQHSRATSQHL